MKAFGRDKWRWFGELQRYLIEKAAFELSQKDAYELAQWRGDREEGFWKWEVVDSAKALNWEESDLFQEEIEGQMHWSKKEWKKELCETSEEQVAKNHSYPCSSTRRSKQQTHKINILKS